MNAGFRARSAALASLCFACSSSEPAPKPEPPRHDPIGRYEPATRIDFDNVVSYGDAPALDLPEPPKSDTPPSTTAAIEYSVYVLPLAADASPE